MIKKIESLIYILFISLSCLASENDVFIDSANNAYSKNNFENAIKYYEKILTSGYESPAIYYNLGNSYYKSNNIPYAILNYERALKMDPNDEDIKFNLKLANQRTIDKIDPVPQLFISEWKNDFTSLYSEKGWSIICIVLLCISLILFGVYLTNKKLLVKQSSFIIALLFLLSSLFTFFIAKKQYESLTEKKEAIVVSPSVNVTSSPVENATKAFVLHEGTKVKVTEINADWVEITIPNGNVGWVKTSSIVFI